MTERVEARIRLSGEFPSEHLNQVKTEIELCELPRVLDLEELELVDVEAVRFLNACESEGISLLHCSPYISKWILRERTRTEARTQKRKRGPIQENGQDSRHDSFSGTVIFDRCAPNSFLASLLATLGKGEFGMEVQSFSPALEGEHGEHE